MKGGLAADDNREDKHEAKGLFDTVSEADKNTLQHGFGRKDDQRLELLRSITAGIPIGSVLVWRTGKHELASFQRIGPHLLQTPPSLPGNVRQYLLDGFQRLSTLLCAFQPRINGERPVVATNDALSTEDDTLSVGTDLSWEIFFDLEQKDFCFKGAEAPPDTWLPVWVALDSIQYLRFQRKLTHPDAEKLIDVADGLVQAVRNYKIAILPLVTDDLDQATRTFERINSQGTPMSEVHMINALKPDFDLRERVNAAKVSLEEIGWGEIDDMDLLDTCKVMLGLDFHEEVMDDLIRELTQYLEIIIEDTLTRVYRVAQFLGDWCQIYSPRLLPSRYQLVLLAASVGKDTAEPTKERLRRWFWLTTYRSAFRGVNGVRLRKLLEHVIALVAGNTTAAWPGFLPAPDFQPLPARFNVKSARCRTLAWHLANIGPHDAEGKKIEDAVRLLSVSDEFKPIALLTTQTAPQLSSALLQSPGNIVLVHRRETAKLRKRLVDSTRSCSPDELEGHAILEPARTALLERRHEDFVKQRLHWLQELDHNYYLSLIAEP